MSAWAADPSGAWRERFRIPQFHAPLPGSSQAQLLRFTGIILRTVSPLPPTPTPCHVSESSRDPSTSAFPYQASASHLIHWHLTDITQAWFLASAHPSGLSWSNERSCKCPEQHTLRRHRLKAVPGCVLCFYQTCLLCNLPRRLWYYILLPINHSFEFAQECFEGNPQDIESWPSAPIRGRRPRPTGTLCSHQVRAGAAFSGLFRPARTGA